MQLARDIADFLVQEAIDERMHVLVARLRRDPFGQASAHAVKSVLQGGALVERDHSRVPEGDSPRLGELHVERPQPQIDANRAIQRIEGRGGTTGEPPAPQFV